MGRGVNSHPSASVQLRRLVEARRGTASNGRPRWVSPFDFTGQRSVLRDRHFAPVAIMQPDGTVHSMTGVLLGGVNIEGRVTAPDGEPLGRADASGRIYNRYGTYAGRVDMTTGAVYDHWDLQAGHVDKPYLGAAAALLLILSD